MIDLEFFQTPSAFTRYLFREMPIVGRCAEVCVGNRAIIEAADSGFANTAHLRTWVTNDLDHGWPADFHHDARTFALYEALGPVDWHVGNPPFTRAIEIIEQCLNHARVGVAMHLRASIHEVLKTGKRRTWMAQHTPTGLLWLPRFAYQRSKTTGKWTTDNVCACWVVWLKDPAAAQFIRYAPERVIEELDAERPFYRARMDTLMKDIRRIA